MLKETTYASQQSTALLSPELYALVLPPYGDRVVPSAVAG